MATARTKAEDGAWSQEDWASFLAEELGRPVAVRYGRARRHVIVAREEEHGLTVRMNAVFGSAPASVRTATASWLRSGKRARRACAELDGWIAAQLEQIVSSAAVRRVRLRTRGEHHDLEDLAGELFSGAFAGERFPLGEPRITWGRRPRRGRRRTLLLGSFDPETNLVRVHPCLDQAAVPGFYVRYILFHELLHALQPTERPARGRAVHHPPEFRAREESYVDYERALAWQREHLKRLLESVRAGEPMRTTRRAKRSLPTLVPQLVQRLLFPD